MRLGANAACPFDDSGHGSCAKKTMSISLTTLWESIAIIVGVASLRMTEYGLPVVATRALETTGMSMSGERR